MSFPACFRPESLESRQLFSIYFVSADPTFTVPPDEFGVPTGAQIAPASVNSLNLEPGDQLLFAAGETFGGPLLLDAADSGAAGSPVLIGSYDSTPEVPTLATIFNASGSGIVGVNVQYITIDGLRVDGGNYATHAGGDGVSFANTIAGNTKLAGLTLQNLEVSNFGASVTTPKRGPAVASGGWGIRVGGTVDKSGYSGVLIEDVSVHHNERGGIEIYGAWNASSTHYANANVTIRRATVNDNYGIPGFTAKHTGSGIILSDTRVGLIEQSVASYNGKFNAAVGGPVGIWAWDADQITIQHNVSHHNQTGSTADGGGFDLDGGVTNSVMQYNLSHDNDGAGYGLFQFSGARPFANNAVRFNISSNDGRRNGYGGITLWNGGSGLTNTEIHNNTIHMSTAATGTPRAIYIQSPTTNVRFRNNILQTMAGVRTLEIVGRHTGLVFQGNAYYAGGGSLSIRDFTTNYTTLDSWRNKTGQEKLNGVNTGYVGNPGLSSVVTPTLNNASTLLNDLRSMTSFRLSDSSPVRNAGVTISGPYYGPALTGLDFFGEPAPEGGWAIGADDAA